MDKGEKLSEASLPNPNPNPEPSITFYCIS